MAAGSIIIDLLLRTGSFETNSANAAKRLKTLQKEAEAVGKAIGVALVAGASAITGIAVASINSLDALKDLSDATGSSVENLSALESIAKKNGATLEDVGATLIKFNKALADADGKDDVSRVLKNIGLDAEKLKKLDPAEALLQVAKAFDKYGTTGESARQVQELFGKSVLKSAPFLKDLAEAGLRNATATTAQAEAAEEFKKQLAAVSVEIQEAARNIVGDLIPAVLDLIKEFNKLRAGGQGSLLDGILGTSAQARTTNEITGISREIDRLNDSMARMQEEMGRPGANVDRLANSIGKLRDKTIELSNQRAKLGETLKTIADLDDPRLPKKAAEPPKPAIKPLPPKVTGTDPFDALIKSAREMEAIAKASLEAEDDLTEAQKFAVKVATDLAAGTLKLSDARVLELDAVLKSADAAQRDIETKKLSAKLTEEAIQDNERFVESQRDRLKNLQESAKAAKEELAVFGMSREAIEQRAIAFEREKAARLDAEAQRAELAYLDKEGKLYRDMADSIREAADARQTLLDAQIKLDTDPLAGATKAVQDYLDVVSKAGRGTYDVAKSAIEGLEDVVTTAFTGKGAKQKAKALIDSLIAEITRLAIVKPLLNSLFGGAGTGGSLVDLIKGFGALFGNGSSWSGGSVGGSVSGSGAGASGYAVGSPYIPTDRMAKLHAGERVLTRKENAEGWGGGTVVEVNNYSGAMVREERSNRGDKKLVRLVVGEVARDSRRGGQTRRATREAIGPPPRRG